MRHADWIVDVGPAAGEHGGEILYSGPPAGLGRVRAVADAALPVRRSRQARRARAATPRGWLQAARRHAQQPRRLDVDFPLGVFTSVTGVSGSGKSSLISQVLVELVGDELGTTRREPTTRTTALEPRRVRDAGRRDHRRHWTHQAAGRGGPEADRPHAALEPRDLHRPVRSRAQAVRRDQGGARAALRRRAASRSTSPRAAARPARAKASCGRAAVPAERLRALPDLPGRALQRQDAGDQDRDKTIADVLGMTVDAAFGFFADDDPLRARSACSRKSAWATCVSGSRPPSFPAGGGQRIKLATELQRAARRDALRPRRTDDRPAPVGRAKLMAQLDGLVEAATRLSSSSTTCAWSRPATGSSTSGPARATRAAG